MKPSIAEIVRRIVLLHPHILDCIRLGIINYSALALRIKNEVEFMLNRKVNVDAIKMALIRFGEELKGELKVLENKVRDVVASSVLELKSDIVVLTVRMDALINRIGDVMKFIGRARFFQLTEGLRTFTLIFDERLVNEVIEVIGEENIEVYIDSQCALILISPRSVIEVPGVIAYITSLLARRGINITQIISCHEDTILIVNREDAAEAYRILEDTILSLRESSK